MDQAKPKMSGRTKAALWLMIAPTGLIFGSGILFALSNLAFTSVAPEAGSLFAEQNPAQVVVNVLLYILGAAGVLSWFPALITGIVLLATKPVPKVQ